LGSAVGIGGSQRELDSAITDSFSGYELHNIDDGRKVLVPFVGAASIRIVALALIVEERSEIWPVSNLSQLKSDFTTTLIGSPEA
jgi:hypothetical protein